ncbi:MAG: winged helix-turn-helix transcriptional regulator [Clostridia bacterium]|nr:winged helix-turn-helix transcriptional regulator [Clostridia bacterium]
MDEIKSADDAGKLAELYKAFADETRVRIMISLGEGAKCVGDIASATGVSQSAVSHQLKTLKYANLVSCQRDGRVITYELADDHVRTIINMGLDHIHE